MGQDTNTGRTYAVKILNKSFIAKENKTKYLETERRCLKILSKHRGIIKLYEAVEDSTSFYFILSFAANGELLSILRKYGSINEDGIRYFGAQILDTIDYMHSMGITHRDLKPENILLDSKMTIKIADFGNAKLQGISSKSDSTTRKHSFVGTAEYLSPEVLLDEECGPECDIWAIGCILYLFISGSTPFKSDSRIHLFQNIVNLNYSFKPGFPTSLKDLILHIFISDPRERFTIKQILNHRFFSDYINWNDKNSIWDVDPPKLEPFVSSHHSRPNSRNNKIYDQYACDNDNHRISMSRTKSSSNHRGRRLTNADVQRKALETAKRLYSELQKPPPNLIKEIKPNFTENATKAAVAAVKASEDVKTTTPKPVYILRSKSQKRSVSVTCINTFAQSSNETPVKPQRKKSLKINTKVTAYKDVSPNVSSKSSKSPYHNSSRVSPGDTERKAYSAKETTFRHSISISRNNSSPIKQPIPNLKQQKCVISSPMAIDIERKILSQEDSSIVKAGMCMIEVSLTINGMENNSSSTTRKTPTTSEKRFSKLFSHALKRKSKSKLKQSIIDTKSLKQLLILTSTGIIKIASFNNNNKNDLSYDFKIKYEINLTSPQVIVYDYEFNEIEKSGKLVISTPNAIFTIRNCDNIDDDSNNNILFNDSNYSNINWIDAILLLQKHFNSQTQMRQTQTQSSRSRRSTSSARPDSTIVNGIGSHNIDNDSQSRSHSIEKHLGKFFGSTSTARKSTPSFYVYETNYGLKDRNNPKPLLGRNGLPYIEEPAAKRITPRRAVSDGATKQHHRLRSYSGIKI